MIDWTGIQKKSPDDWIALSIRLISRVRALLGMETPDLESVREAQRDLGEFIGAANLKCPETAVRAATRASEQLTVFLASSGIEDLERRNDRLDAVRARLSSASNELQADAAKLRLDTVRGVLVSATKVAAELEVLVGQIEGMTKAELPGKLDAVARQAAKVAKELEGALKGATS